MKKLLLGAVSAAAMLTAGAAFAAGNDATIDQIGNVGSATVDQTQSSGDAVATITQGTGTGANDFYNTASVTQGGSANQATITQSQGDFGVVTNPSNTSISDQEGASGVIIVTQVGNSASSIQQTSTASNEHAFVGQLGSGDASGIIQSGASELAVVNQEPGGPGQVGTGTGNTAAIVQSGTGDGVFSSVQFDAVNFNPNPALFWYENVPGDSLLPGTSAGNTQWGPVGAIVDQLGQNNIGAINQAGYENFADVSQENDFSGNVGNTDGITQGIGNFYSDAVTYQYGQGNTIFLTQEGSGSAYSVAFQQGNNNQAYVAQTGSETSTVGQGMTVDITNPTSPDAFDANAVNNDYANVTQSSGGDTSTVFHSGDSNQAWVSQTVQANATSTINQSGGSNAAVVKQ